MGAELNKLSVAVNSDSKKLTLTPNTDTNKKEVFMKRFFVLVLALGFIFAGCAEKQAVKPEQPATQETAQKAAAPEPGKQAEPVAAKAEPKRVETVPVTEVVEAKPVAALENIHFDFDKYDIRDDAKPTLKVVSDWFVKNKSAKMLLEGIAMKGAQTSITLRLEKEGQSQQGITLYHQAWEKTGLT